LLVTRLLTAVVLLSAFLAANLLLERTVFAALVVVVVGLAGHEWGRLCRMPERAALAYGMGMAMAFVLLVWLLFPVSVSIRAAGAIFAVASVFWLIGVPLWLHRGLGNGRLLPVAGLLVVLPAALAMVALSGPQLLLVLALVWIADTAAYVTGRAFGRRKLAPSISPGKTWEGAGGALAGTLAYAIVCAMLVPPLSQAVQGAAWLPYLGGAALLCAVSILGDLLESAVKRQASVKDSGTLLPGHGGVLDRIDSATAVLPVAVLMLYWIAPI
jgi:phosphatidate cytidylyltransferase